MEQSAIISELRKQIKDNVVVNDDVVCDLCDSLIKEASLKNDTESIAFAYIWKADHYFYVEPDQKILFDCLHKAERNIDENKPSKLLEKFYTLFRLYYHSFADHKISLSYALKALQVAEALQDKLRISANLGIIGEMYLDHAYYPQALHYLNESLHSLDHDDPDSYGTMRLILISIFDCLVHLDRFDEAKQTLEQLSKVKVIPEKLKIYLDRCRMIYYSYLKDEENTNIYAKELLNDGALEFKNPTFVFDFISNYFRSMMRIDNKKEANNALTMLRQVTREKDYDSLLKIAFYQIEYNKRFDVKQLSESYKVYYNRYNDAENLLEQIKTEGLNAKLSLHETTRQQAEMEEKMKVMEDEANLDELSRVYNRRYLNFKQTAILHDKTNKNIGFILLDIDYFKEYNDTYGHVLGDDVIKNVASILQTHRPKNMDVCRYGGDEFICICWNTSLDEMDSYIKDIQADLHKLNTEHSGSPCSDRVTLSIGYGLHDLPMKAHIFSFLENVDKALYYAKEKGRNNAVSLSEESEVVTNEK